LLGNFPFLLETTIAGFYLKGIFPKTEYSLNPDITSKKQFSMNPVNINSCRKPLVSEKNNN
jgi:hypothetical protein